MNTYQRKERGVTQKIFLIEVIQEKNQILREYVVMGITGNVYNVTISNEPSCTCPDYTQRHNRCKHIYFILLRVMKITDPDKDKYSDDDLTNMFLNIPEITKALCVDGKIRDKYIASSSKKSVTIKNDDLCPMCLDDIENGDEYDYCKNGCGKCIHKICFESWCKNHPVACLICKAQWDGIGVSNYINLK